MKIDKERLFNAIKNKETEVFKMTYDTNSYEYNPQDITALEIFRLFVGEDEFLCVEHLQQNNIDNVVGGFDKINQELKKLNCINLKGKEM